MPSYKAGQEVDAYCTKCKMDLLHKIVAVASGKPVKVECRTCYTTHMYRAPKGVKTPGGPAVAPPSSASASSSSSGGSSSRAARKSVAPAIVDAPLVPPSHAHVHIYKFTERYAAETWISHKQFGIGQVLREVGPGKIEVRFEGGPRVLIHNKTE